MNRILITGFTPLADGINSFIKNIYPYIDRDLFQFDYLIAERYRGIIERSWKFNDYGSNIYYLEYSRKEMPKRSRKQLKEILQSIPDLRGVHVHDTNQVTYPLFLADQMGFPVKVIHYHTAFPKHGQLPPVDPHIKGRLNLIRGDRFDRLACSDLAGICGFRGLTFEVIPNGIDPEKFSFNPLYRKLVRNQLGAKEGTYVIGFFANISDVKNPIFALKTFQEFLKLAPDSIFLFVGINMMGRELTDYIDRHSLRDHVRFMQTDKSIDMLYCAADLALCTSLREGIGYSWIEAQASGLACLISDEVTDQVRITNLAHMMPLESPPEAWAKKILHILQNKKQRVSHTREITDRGFHAKDAAQKLQELYLHRITGNY